MRTGWMRGMRRVGWRRVRFRGGAKKRRCSFSWFLGVGFVGFGGWLRAWLGMSVEYE